MKRLDFNTPEKRYTDWRVSSGHEEYTRRLFESNRKGIDSSNSNILFVMPFFEDEAALPTADDILKHIFSMINE